MDEGGDWDLQAVVRGCGGGAAATTAAEKDPLSLFPPSFLLEEDDGLGLVGGGGGENNDLRFCFPNALATETSVEEMEELCRPFFHKSPTPPDLPPQKYRRHHQQLQEKDEETMAPMSSPGKPTGGFAGTQPQQPISTQSTAAATTARSKRRKNQQKKVVCHVPADGLSSDMWAWRKYGQKPIKGSPYPRGYYRCSSSKGCQARKQVERNRTDPNLLVITYSAEHNHPVPTHRNSLAGSTRNKFSLPTSSSTIAINQVNGDVNSSSLSPTATLTSSSTENEFLPKMEEGEGEEEVEVENDDEGMLVVSDMEMLGEDEVLLLGFDELHQSYSDGNHLATAFSSSSPLMSSSGR